MRNAASLLAITLLFLLCAAPAPKDAAITMRGLQFSPAELHVKPGQPVTWINNDDRDHSVYGPEVRSGNIKPGRSFTYSFARAGSYSYGCAYHPRMSGTVVVSE